MPVHRDGHVTSDSSDTKHHRWKDMQAKDGYFSLVNCAVVTQRLQMKDAKTFGVGRAGVRCSDEYLFHFIDLDPFDNGQASLSDAAAKCQQMLGMRHDQLDRNKAKAEELERTGRRLAETSAAVSRKYKR